jgi:hypothetical protein
MDDRCRRIDELVTEAMTRELSPDERRAVEEHCSSCADCAAAYRAVTAARAALQHHRPEDDAPSDDLRAAFHRRLVERQAQREKERPFGLGLRWKWAVGMAACLFLLVLGYGLLPVSVDRTDEGTVISRSTVGAQEPITIRMIYTADRPLADVRVTIRLDEGIVFATDNEELRALREYTWKGDLKTGANEIPFAVEMRKMGTRLIRTEAAYEGYLHRHDVELQADRETVVLTYLSYRKKPI